MLRRAGHAYPESDPRHYRPPEEVIADLQSHTLQRMQAFYRDFAGASHGQLSAVGPCADRALSA